MSEGKYYIIASATFEKKYKKLLMRDGDMREFFASALAQLERDPKTLRSTKKLVGIADGNGEWRIRMGVYRMRYDIDGSTVYLHTIALHTIGLRKDIYKKKR